MSDDAKAELERMRDAYQRLRTEMHRAVAGLDDHGRAHMVTACRMAPGACFCGMHISRVPA